MHTHTRTHTRARGHAGARADTHTHTHTHTHTLTGARARARAGARAPACVRRETSWVRKKVARLHGKKRSREEGHKARRREGEGGQRRRREEGRMARRRRVEEKGGEGEGSGQMTRGMDWVMGCREMQEVELKTSLEIGSAAKRFSKPGRRKGITKEVTRDRATGGGG